MITEMLEKNKELWNKFVAFYTYYTTIVAIMFFIFPEVAAFLFLILYMFLFLDGVLSVIYELLDNLKQKLESH